jgi:hypothetical protein
MEIIPDREVWVRVPPSLVARNHIAAANAIHLHSSILDRLRRNIVWHAALLCLLVCKQDAQSRTALLVTHWTAVSAVGTVAKNACSHWHASGQSEKRNRGEDDWTHGNCYQLKLVVSVYQP